MSQHSHKYSSSSRFSRDFSRSSVDRNARFRGREFFRHSTKKVFTTFNNRKKLFSAIRKKIVIQWHWKKNYSMTLEKKKLRLNYVRRTNSRHDDPACDVSGREGGLVQGRERQSDRWLLPTAGTWYDHPQHESYTGSSQSVVRGSQKWILPQAVADYYKRRVRARRNFFKNHEFFNFVIKCHKIWQNVIKFVNFCHNFFYNASGVFEIIHWVFSQEPVNGPFSEHMCRYYHLYYR